MGSLYIQCIRFHFAEETSNTIVQFHQHDFHFYLSAAAIGNEVITKNWPRPLVKWCVEPLTCRVTTLSNHCGIHIWAYWCLSYPPGLLPKEPWHEYSDSYSTLCDRNLYCLISDNLYCTTPIHVQKSRTIYCRFYWSSNIEMIPSIQLWRYKRNFSINVLYSNNPMGRTLSLQRASFLHQGHQWSCV